MRQAIKRLPGVGRMLDSDGWKRFRHRITLVTDAGYMSSGITGSFPSATAIAKALMGRS